MATEAIAVTNNEEPSLVKKDANKTEDDDSKPIGRYIMIGVITIALVLLVYYAYSRFIDNSSTGSTPKDTERDEPITDFNLREAIKNLQNIQRNVLKTLSDIIYNATKENYVRY